MKQNWTNEKEVSKWTRHLLDFIESKNMSVSLFERKCDIANGYVRAMRKNDKPTARVLKRIRDAFPDFTWNEADTLPDPKKKSIAKDSVEERLYLLSKALNRAVYEVGKLKAEINRLRKDE